MRVRLVRDDRLSERLAVGRVEQAAMMVDLHRHLDLALVNVGVGHVLHIAGAGRERHAGRIALRLGRDIEVNRALQPFARARHLGIACRRGKQCSDQNHSHEGKTFHRSSSRNRRRFYRRARTECLKPPRGAGRGRFAASAAVQH